MSKEEKTEEQINRMQQIPNPPWLDLRLTKEAMDYLWDDINRTDRQANVREESGGPNSNSFFIEDKDDWFYENVLKKCTETLYFREWSNYYNVHVVNIVSPPEFVVKDFWVNSQKQHEFSPPHLHSGIFSFVVFMKIPTHWKEQHALPWLKDVKEPRASDFQFLLGQVNGQVQLIHFHLCPEDEGRMLFFPSWLMHQVFPFYGTEEERITVSGNIFFPGDTQGKSPF